MAVSTFPSLSSTAAFYSSLVVAVTSVTGLNPFVVSHFGASSFRPVAPWPVAPCPCSAGPQSQLASIPSTQMSLNGSPSLSVHWPGTQIACSLQSSWGRAHSRRMRKFTYKVLTFRP
ncbi:hypothetical protein BC826DRAFT_1022058 [Russula brevipes]|nr:hypothetical protein BC826DRAFT_1022058 [Russula brevipes]